MAKIKDDIKNQSLIGYEKSLKLRNGRKPIPSKKETRER